MSEQGSDEAHAPEASEPRAWSDRTEHLARRLGVVAAFAIGLGLILVGIGNGIWRLTALAELGEPDGLLTFLFHLATASVLVVLGALLLPVALHAFSDETVSLEQPARLFATLWIVIGAAHLFTGQASGEEAIGGSIVLLLAGLFGLLAVSRYEPEPAGSSLSAGVLGLVAGGLLVGGVATVPGSITGASRLGSEIVFRYGEALHVAGYLVATLAATVTPFVKDHERGQAAVRVGLGLAGLVWGLGEVVFAAWWLAGAPWTLFAQLGAGATVGYAFVLLGGLATVLGGLAVLGGAGALAARAGWPLAASLSEASDGEATLQRACPSCGSQVTTGRQACPGCGHELTAG